MSNDGPDYKPTPAVGMPAQPTTVQLPAVPAWAIELTKSVKDGFQGVNARLDTVEGNLDLQGAQGVDLGKRMTALETRVGGIEERQGRHSGGTQQLADEVRETSSINLKQDAAIGVLVGKVDALGADVADLKMSQATQTTILQLLESGTKTLAGNPHVRLLVGLLWTALLGYLASKGLASK